MNLYFYKNRKKIVLVGVLLIFSGIILAYFNWGIEPGETISGVFCGIGFGLSVVGLGMQKPKEL